MTLQYTQTDKLARSLLAKQGIGAIWDLHQAAAAAHRAGFPHSAAALIEVAEAAERAWLSSLPKKLAGIALPFHSGMTATPLAIAANELQHNIYWDGQSKNC